ncbi:tetratricopeptide repeat protein [Oceanihabitans sp. 2_MG-2023]|uniref:tetratricopeptide repeat protein n=1 Tax=Oceanihabitans sp. 2_MG-2023 TaxID=3062661 RepID=UPI0026E17460|nr:tetratricopeptide repeat protein [Oceanihabitans sp. 2_MG-2023]MDO6598449.1 tetratricopeptide repeat protein [Oceanihabitans sp. 2_MG-2023]
MTIKFNVNDFLFQLFPVEKNNIEELHDLLKRFYTEGPFEPEIEIIDNIITVKIDSTTINEDKESYQRLVNLCEKGQFSEAKPLVQKLISKTPNVSEYYRIYGQILSEEGEQEEAINNLIDALRWNPKNEWALLMMGNIFAKYKGDTNTALTYYNQVLVVKPNDHLTLNNIGANLMQLGKTKDALQYFNKALKVQPNYPNTHLALGLIAEKEQDFEDSFKHALNALKANKNRDVIHDNSFRIAIESAQKLTKNINGQKVVNDFLVLLETQCGKPIRVEIDENISTAAKIEFAEYYDRTYHLVKYKSSYPAVEHLVMHELMHLELVTEARNQNLNQLFVTNDSLKSKFIYSLDKFAKKLKNSGVSDDGVSNYLQLLFNGINLQAYNTPIDLFIEDRIYNNYPELRPFQFLSMLAIVQEGINASTNPEVVKKSPSSILSKSKIFNLVNALHLKDLYQVDLIKDHNPTKLELNQAKEFYTEFEDYRKDKAPSEEYELVQHWAEDLKIDAYFELVPENKNNRKTIEDVLSEIEEDPFGLNTIDPSKERKMKKFLDSHSDKSINSAVAMYMVGALEFFKSMNKVKVKELAFEFATLGMTGIDPNKDGYSIPSIKNTSFSGYKALAYYYVSWAVGIPEMLSQLQMPFDKEYALAKKLFNL